ncbi:hypothetical protein GJ496_005898 [Pomphorhynchus laevis]|nr:hypothetical protein GJ496_005898 [Pomphorhynchus laevis]
MTSYHQSTVVRRESLITFEFKERVYENWCFLILPRLSTSIILDQKFISHHQNITFKFRCTHSGKSISSMLTAPTMNIELITLLEFEKVFILYILNHVSIGKGITKN